MKKLNLFDVLGPIISDVLKGNSEFEKITPEDIVTYAQSIVDENNVISTFIGRNYG